MAWASTGGTCGIRACRWGRRRRRCCCRRGLGGSYRRRGSSGATKKAADKKVKLSARKDKVKW